MSIINIDTRVQIITLMARIIKSYNKYIISIMSVKRLHYLALLSVNIKKRDKNDELIQIQTTFFSKFAVGKITLFQHSGITKIKIILYFVKIHIFIFKITFIGTSKKLSLDPCLLTIQSHLRRQSNDCKTSFSLSAYLHMIP